MNWLFLIPINLIVGTILWFVLGTAWHFKYGFTEWSDKNRQGLWFSILAMFVFWPLFLIFSVFNYWKQWSEVFKVFTGQRPLPPRSVYFWWIQKEEVK